MVIYYHNYGENMISFRSKITIKLLDYFFLNPDAQAYINELARILEIDPKNTETKLKELEKGGLLKSEFRGKQRYYFLAKNNPILEHYRQIFLKTYGIEKKLSDMVNRIKGLQEAYLFGSYAANKMDSSSDIDILAIGTHSVLELQRAIAILQKDTGREFNVINLSDKEFEKKKKGKNPFLNNIFKSKIIKLK
ncbi:MAG: nucleotidyltransferase domain-containing protein [Candidatus Omnitrophica bacterium]|jgi:predicted nucleotidyltransferase|nr:nucleotidyltransferase domain-containing protein [Candidatus Omnitrophota bacterium]